MSIASKALTKLASPHWGASCAVGVVAALSWMGMLACFSQGDADTSTALSVLRQRWPFVAGGVFLLSALSFQLLRETKAGPDPHLPMEAAEEAKLHLNAQLLIGLYDETIFSETELASASLPAVLLNTQYKDIALLAKEQSAALLAPTHFESAVIHRHSLSAPDLKGQLEQFKTALETLRVHSDATDVHLFQGVLEASDKQTETQLIPWAFTLRSAGHRTPTVENEGGRNLQSLELLFNTCSMPLPLCIAKWLTP